MRSVELFSGCGGLALGTSRAGFEHERLVEWDTDACATLTLNKKRRVEHARDWSIFHGDVKQFDWSQIKAPIDVVAGGPPCQPFSIGGKHRGKSDVRDMWPEAIRAVRELNPKAFLFENVRGLARPAFADYLAWIKTYLSVPFVNRWEDEAHSEHLERLRDYSKRAIYDVMIQLVNAADFGAAQKRHRIVVIGIRRDLGVSIAPLTTTHSRERLLWDQWISGEYWVRHGLKTPKHLATDADRSLVAKLRAGGKRPSGRPWRTVRDALKGLGDPNGKNNHVFQDGARAYVGHTGSPMDEPAKALKAGDHGVPGGENMMVRDDGTVRYFTVREAARLQGLPDDWAFASSWTESMRQLGNAVPTQLAQAVGRWIVVALEHASTALRAA